MTRWLAPLAAAAALGCAVSLPAAPAKKASPAAARRDWSRTVVQTPEGGFRIGSPQAPVKLVEYGSLTCPHCATFHKEAMAELKRDHIASGRVSYEFRNFVLNGPDLAASLIARCDGPSGFFRHTDYFYGQQQQWVASFASMDQAESKRLSLLPQDQMLLGMAKAAGLETRMAARGMPAARTRQCLSSKPNSDQLMKLREGGMKLGVQGTPGFFVNGSRVAAYDWASLKPLLRPPGS